MVKLDELIFSEKYGKKSFNIDVVERTQCMDALWARRSRSRDERLELYRAADRRLVAEDAWIVPTAYPTWHVLHRPSVDGMWTHPMGIGTLDDVVVRRRG